MRPSIDTIKGFLHENDLHFMHVPEHDALILDFRLSEVHCKVFIRDLGNFVIVDIKLPCMVPAHRRHHVAELATRINFGNRWGRIDLDWSDGEVQVHSAIPTIAPLQCEQTFQQVFNGCLGLAHHYFATIMAVAYGETAAATAYAKLDQNNGASDEPQKASDEETEPHDTRMEVRAPNTVH